MKTLSDYMKINYRMKIVEDAEEGGFVVSFPELPGCFTCGDTKEKAIANPFCIERVQTRGYEICVFGISIPLRSLLSGSAHEMQIGLAKLRK